MLFWNSLAFLMIQRMLAIWSLVPLPFLQPAWTSGSSRFTLLKPGLENFEHYFTSVWDECNCAVVWAFFGIAFLWDWNENWPFPEAILNLRNCFTPNCSFDFSFWNNDRITRSCRRKKKYAGKVSCTRCPAFSVVKSMVQHQVFPDGPVVQTLSFHCGWRGFDPGGETKIPHGSQSSLAKKKKKRRRRRNVVG